MSKRILDVLLAIIALIVVSPLLALAAVAIRVASNGPMLYRARLTGRGGQLFTMYKLRTMNVEQGDAPSVITAHNDPRVFRLGAWLRQLKIDELPQLINVIRGDMSIVGPRPEHPRIVAGYYGPDDWELLRVRPGLTSPGTLYACAHGDLVGTPEPERMYVEQLLPIRLALDHVYIRRASLRYDAALVGRTVGLMAATLLGRRAFANPPEYAEARRQLDQPHPAKPGEKPRQFRVSPVRWGQVTRM